MMSGVLLGVLMLGWVAGCLFIIWNGFGSSKFKSRSYTPVATVATISPGAVGEENKTLIFAPKN